MTVERRQQILLEASALFAEGGYEGTSIRGIAKACGITEAAIYRHYASKAHLYEEVIRAKASQHDISRFGAEVVRFSPRQADLMLVCGTISYKQAPILKRIYEQMPHPRWVVSMGACASSGGIYDNYCTVQGIDTVIPVDVYISGCPPRPEAVLDALIKIQEKIQTESVLVDRHQDFKGILD